jgi:6-phospho-beta-glucosidase
VVPGLARTSIADNVISNPVKPYYRRTTLGVKIAVVGGGSTYTPELVEGFVNRAARLPIDELVLLDIDSDRLAVVGGLAQRMLDRLDWVGRLTLTGQREAAIDGADFVLIQLRVGGQATRLVDETLPPRFGVIGQETTGAGGFAKALRTVPVVLELAELTARRAAPGAWIVDFTNPVGIVTQALLDHGHRALGLCNVAINIQRTLAGRFGVTPDRMELEHVGLNHLSWERAARVDGVDRLPELLADDAPWIADHVGMPVDLVRAVGAIPSYYLRYYYQTAKVVADQRNGHTRAQDVIDIESRLLDLYRDQGLAEKPALLADRGGAYYSEAAAQLIASLYDGAGDIQVVDVRNDGALPDLADSAVVEIAARIDRDGAHPLPVAPLSPEMRGLVQAAKAYEELAVMAATTGDRRIALRALMANPLVGDWAIAEPLLDALLDANRAHLPRFFP